MPTATQNTTATKERPAWLTAGLRTSLPEKELAAQPVELPGRKMLEQRPHAEKARRLAVAKLDAYLMGRKKEAEAKVEAAEKAQSAKLAAIRQIGDYFHTGCKAPLNIHSTSKPLESLSKAIPAIAKISGSRFLTIATPSDIADPAIARALAEAVGSFYARGIGVQVLGQTIEGTRDELMARYSGPEKLLGTTPGIDQVQVFHSRTYDGALDPDAKVRSVPLGQILGGRMIRDGKDGYPGGTYAGICGRENRGVLKAGTRIYHPLEEGEIFDLWTLGLNGLNEIQGAVAIWGNRTLLDPGASLDEKATGAKVSRNIFANVVRGRLWIMATFYGLCQKYMLFAPTRDRGSVQAAGATMRELLLALKSRGYLEQADVHIDANALTLEILSLISAVPPVELINLKFLADEKEFLKLTA